MNSGKIGYRTILKQKEYMKVIIASIINRFGDSVDAVAYTCQHGTDFFYRRDF